VAAILVLGVAAPTLLVTGIGEATGLKRTQEPWAVQAPIDAARLSRLESPHRAPSLAPLGREAWSESFRLDPPRLLAADAPLVPPGTALLDLPLRPFRIDDGRLLSLLALALSAALLLRLAEERALVLGLLVVAPFAVGVMFGSPVPVALSLLLAAAALARRERDLGAGLLAGAACACSHELVLAAPFVLVGALTPTRASRALAGLAAGYAALVVPVAVLDPSAYMAFARAPVPFGAGVGIANVFYWRGLEEYAATHALFALLPIAVAALWLVALLRARGSDVAREPLAALFVLLGLVVSRQASAASLAIPLSLIVLGAFSSFHSPASARRSSHS
jgi:hypothetical protein